MQSNARSDWPVLPDAEFPFQRCCQPQGSETIITRDVCAFIETHQNVIRSTIVKPRVTPHYAQDKYGFSGSENLQLFNGLNFIE
jgi:hypothetical protein